MKRIRTFLFLGIWVAILPYLGFPYFWKNLLFVLTGLSLVIFAYFMYREHKHRQTTNKPTFDNFSENSDFNASSNNEPSEENI